MQRYHNYAAVKNDNVRKISQIKLLRMNFSLKKYTDKLNPFQNLEITNAVIEMLLKGTKRSEILVMIDEISPVKLTDSEIIQIYESGIKFLEKNVEMDILKVAKLHVINYEEMYKYFDSIGNVEGKNKCMKAKERLLGIHKNSSLKISKRSNITITAPSEYDATKLSPEDRKRFNQLIEKARV